LADLSPPSDQTSARESFAQWNLAHFSSAGLQHDRLTLQWHDSQRKVPLAIIGTRDEMSERLPSREQVIASAHRFAAFDQRQTTLHLSEEVGARDDFLAGIAPLLHAEGIEPIQ
jgi:hypothetical protein